MNPEGLDFDDRFPSSASVLPPNELCAVPSSVFNYDVETRTFAAEMSDLQAYPRAFGPVYDDACDVGLTIRSGKCVVFVEVGREYAGRGEDRELQRVWYKSLSKTQATNPHLKLVLFND